MNLNIKSKLTLAIGCLEAMIVLLVALSIVNLHELMAAEPDSPAARTGLFHAIAWIGSVGSICIFIGLGIFIKLPVSIDRPIGQLVKGIFEIANHNYDVRLDLKGDKNMEELSRNFNRMARRLNIYHNSTLSELMASQRYMETVINSIREAVIGFDNEMNILFINDKALDILNLKRSDIIGQPAQKTAMKNDLLRRLLNGLPGGREENREALKIYADNKESYFQTRYMDITMKGRDGISMEKKGDVIILENITELQEQHMAQSSFITTVSRDLKTPLTKVLTGLRALQGKRPGNIELDQKKLIEECQEHCEHALGIINELMDVARIETGRLQLRPKLTKPIELIEYAIKSNRVQAEKFGVQIEVEYPENGKIGDLFVDSEKIAWVLTNLLSNAIRYSLEGERVIIGARQRDNETVEIFVRDFGKGIDPRYHKSIFEHYFRVPGMKVQGIGLGLSISKDFVEAHGGMLSVQSEPGKGSLFVVKLNI